MRELITLVPDGSDRKCETLVRAIEQVRREHQKEKFLIFTQYRETLEYLREGLGKLYGAHKIATIKGGPLDDKIAAVESFSDPEDAQFLISTSAGGEGINLQVCHIVFNYDLPWNPMALEQRIGRIHRYGQRDTAQIYNLLAEDTVEERIYGLLEHKLLEIAQTIGRVDPVTGQVTEDFRSEILGFLGSAPNYQELYKKALVDKDYRRTEREISEAVERAREASEALRNLTQGLDAFQPRRLPPAAWSLYTRGSAGSRYGGRSAARGRGSSRRRALAHRGTARASRGDGDLGPVRERDVRPYLGDADTQGPTLRSGSSIR